MLSQGMICVQLSHNHKTRNTSVLYKPENKGSTEDSPQANAFLLVWGLGLH